MKTENMDTDDPLEELFYDLLWGLILTPFLTFPFTMYLFKVSWSRLSLSTGITILVVTWILVSIFIVQSGRDYLKRRAKQ